MTEEQRKDENSAGIKYAHEKLAQTVNIAIHVTSNDIEGSDKACDDIELVGW